MGLRRASAAMELWPWAGMIGAAAGWILAHQIGSDGTFYECDNGTTITLVVGILSLILTAGSGLASFRLWRRGGETEARRFIALVGWLFAILLGLAILLPTIAGLIIPECVT
jgi:hypothetical protein